MSQLRQAPGALLLTLLTAFVAALGGGTVVHKLGANGGTTLDCAALWASFPTSWYIDPANASGSASDANDCATQSTPCRSCRQVMHRWTETGCGDPHLNVHGADGHGTRVWWMSAGAGVSGEQCRFDRWIDDGLSYPGRASDGGLSTSAIVRFSGALTGPSGTLFGPSNGTATEATHGTIGSFTNFNEPAGTLTQIQFNVSSGSLHAHELCFNSTAAARDSHGPTWTSAAFTHTLVSGTTWTMSTVLYQDTTDWSNNGDLPSGGNAWAASDIVTCYDPIKVNLLSVLPQMSSPEINTVPETSGAVSFLHIVGVNDPTLGDPYTDDTFKFGEPILVTGNIIEPGVVPVWQTGVVGNVSGLHNDVGVAAWATSGGAGDMNDLSWTGGGHGPEWAGGIWEISYANASGILGSGAILYSWAHPTLTQYYVGSMDLRCPYVSSGITLNVTNDVSSGVGTGLGPTCNGIWGPGNLNVQGSARVAFRYNNGGSGTAHFGYLTGTATLNGMDAGLVMPIDGSTVPMQVGITNANCEYYSPNAIYRPGGSSIECSAAVPPEHY